MHRTKLSLLVRYGNGTIETAGDSDVGFVRFLGLTRGGIDRVHQGITRCEVDLNPGNLKFDYHQSSN